MTGPIFDVDRTAPRTDGFPVTNGMAGVVRSRVGHNAVLNFFGLAGPLALAFIIMPIAARHLGPARFGLLGLAWAVTEYLTLFDLGLGRALVKFVADALHQDSTDLSEIVSFTLMAQVVAGIVGGLAFVLTAPILIHDVFRVARGIESEALATFQVVGLSVPAVLLISAQRSVLEGAQRFDLSAILKLLSSTSSLAIPAIGAVLGASVPRILIVVLVARGMVCILYSVAIRRALPHLHWVWSREWVHLRRVLSFGRWVLISNTVNPLLVYFDRFALGTIAGLAAAGFYTAPYEGVTRMLLIPVSLFGSLLPALTSLEAKRDRERFTRLAAAAERILAPVMAVPLAVVLVFAPELLRLWLGEQYAAQTATALRFLAVGVFSNSLANPLFVILYAKGRPDLPAKFHLVELLVHIPLTIFLIRGFGIAGAAAAWASRVSLDMFLLALAAGHVSRTSLAAITGGRLGRTTLGIALLLAALVATKLLARISVAEAVVGSGVVVGIFLVGTWSWILEGTDRAAVSGTLRSYIESRASRSLVNP